MIVCVCVCVLRRATFLGCRKRLPFQQNNVPGGLLLLYRRKNALRLLVIPKRIESSHSISRPCVLYIYVCMLLKKNTTHIKKDDERREKEKEINRLRRHLCRRSRHVSMRHSIDSSFTWWGPWRQSASSFVRLFVEPSLPFFSVVGHRDEQQHNNPSAHFFFPVWSRWFKRMKKRWKDFFF